MTASRPSAGQPERVPHARRLPLVGFPQHVVQRGNDGERCFVETADFAEYISRLAAASARNGVAVHAYVLMTNHVHLLATQSTPQGIGKCMQSVGSGFVPSFNARRGRTGTLWDGRYFSSVVGSDAYFWNCHRYIELNPVRAGIVESPGQYRWSSYHGNALNHADPLVTHHDAYLQLGKDGHARTAAYRKLFDSPLGGITIQEIRDRLRTERAFGDADFLMRVEEVTGRPAASRPRGRPRKQPDAEK
jgi:putative transposase